MTLSMKKALDTINDKKGAITLQELRFFLVTLRDNAKHDDVHAFLDKALKESRAVG